MVLDGQTIQELYKRGLLNEKALKHINMLNHYEALRSQKDKHAAKKTATKYRCTVQNLHYVKNKNRGLKN